MLLTNGSTGNTAQLFGTQTCFLFLCLFAAEQEKQQHQQYIYVCVRVLWKNN